MNHFKHTCFLAARLMLMVLFLGAFQYVKAQAPVTGTVTDSSGNPLAGVSVQVKGSKTGVVTNTQGSYTINAKPTDVLVFTYVGYQQQQATVGGKTNVNIN